MASYSYDETAERCVLGALLLGEQSALESAKSILSSRDFYEARHQKLFDTILYLSELSQAVDLVSVQEDLTRKGVFEDIGGMQFLVGLFDALPVSQDVDGCAETVRLCALWRHSFPSDL